MVALNRTSDADKQLTYEELLIKIASNIGEAGIREIIDTVEFGLDNDLAQDYFEHVIKSEQNSINHLSLINIALSYALFLYLSMEDE